MDTIKYEDFAKVDIRIGTVTEAMVPEWSHWVMKITVDLGSEIGIKTCFSGIMKFYKPEDLVGKQFPFVVNLEPREMMGEVSEGMLFDIGHADGLVPVLAMPEKPVPAGTRAE